ncbi:hypothetical protein [Acidisoma sp. 7E03]
MVQIDSPTTVQGIEAFDDLAGVADRLFRRPPHTIRILGQAADRPDNACFCIAKRPTATAWAAITGRGQMGWGLARLRAPRHVRRQRQGTPSPHGECGLLYLHREEVRFLGSRRTPTVSADWARIDPIHRNDGDIRFDIDSIKT